MSTVATSQELALTADQQQQLAEKQGAWSKFVERAFRVELSLNMQVANQRQKLQLPTAVEHIAAAEVQLVDLKKARKAIEEQRKAEVSNTLDKYVKRLMIPEKDMDAMIQEVSAALLPLKQKYEQMQRAKAEKEREVQQIIALIKTTVNNNDMAYRQKINQMITVAYQFALDSDQSPDTIDTYLEKCSRKLGPAEFQSTKPDFKLRLVTIEEAEELMNEHWRDNPFAYADMYQKELRAKFSDYEVAFKNKADALALAAKEAKERDRQLKEEAERKALAAQMEASATTVSAPTVGAPRKAVKYDYEIDMEENEVNAAKIDAQYWANINLTRHKTRAAWFKLTIGQKAKALADVKNDDPAFVPEGITFKSTPRL